MPLKIIRDFDKNERVLPDEALRLGACTLKEINDAIRKDGYDVYHSALPVWTSTHIEYKAGATEALVWNEGEKKKTKINLPLQDGWYLPDKKWGIPNGEKSSESNPDAMYLWRWQNDAYSGLLVRGGGFGVWGRRGVGAVWGSGGRLGVIESALKKTKHKHEFVKKLVCKTCGEEK
jgi:hypothetical protein